MTSGKPTSKAYSYLRFSTPEQMKGDSFRRQTELAERYAERNGLVIDDELRLSDFGVSAYRAKNVRQGALGRFLQAIDDGLVPIGSYLLVENLDRVSRASPWDAMPIFQQIINAGVTIVTLQDERTWSRQELVENPFRIFESLMVMIRANEESEVKARRLRAVWTAKRSRASDVPMTARTPAWIALDRDSRVFSVVEQRAAIVRRIYNLSASGTGQHKIAETLNREGVSCFGGAAHWHRSYITKLLDNPAVVGRLVPHEMAYDEGKRLRLPLEPIESYYPAIVAKELYEAVQAQRAAGRAPVVRVGHSISNLLAGLAKCPECGGTMTRVTKGAKAKSGKPFLVCQKAKAGAGCAYRSVQQDKVETAMLIFVSDWLGDRPSGNNELDQQLDEARATLAAVNDAIDTLLEQISMGASEALSRELARLEGQKEALEKSYRELRRKFDANSSASVNARCSALRASFERRPLDKTEANAILRQLLNAVTIDYRTEELEFAWLNGGINRLAYSLPFEPVRS